MKSGSFCVKGWPEVRKPGLTVYLADANVLLNLSALGRLDVLRLCADCLGWRIVVPRCILDEVEGEMSAQDLVVRGVQLVEPEAAIAAKLVLARVQDGISSRLSDADAELYVRAKETRGTVWTDDGPLVRLLEQKGIPQVHTFAPFLKLLELGEVESRDVLECGRRLAELNPRFTAGNLEDLVRKVRATEASLAEGM